MFPAAAARRGRSPRAKRGSSSDAAPSFWPSVDGSLCGPLSCQFSASRARSGLRSRSHDVAFDATAGLPRGPGAGAAAATRPLRCSRNPLITHSRKGSRTTLLSSLGRVADGQMWPLHGCNLAEGSTCALELGTG
eukprot:1406606-Pleurochrysis_carterae.AAC.3